MSQVMVTRFAKLILILLSVFVMSRTAVALSPHVHGIALLQIAVDQNEIKIYFDSPLENLLGFERAPANEQQRQAVKAMVTRLLQADQLFLASEEALCRLHSVHLTAPVLSNEDKQLHPETPIAKDAHSDEFEHAQLEADISLHCANPEALLGLEIGLFNAFPLLKQLEAEIISANGQTRTVLTPNTTYLHW